MSAFALIFCPRLNGCGVTVTLNTSPKSCETALQLRK